MVHVWWETTFMPGEGLIVRRFQRKGICPATCEAEYDRLTWGEHLDVLEADMTWILSGGDTVL